MFRLMVFIALLVVAYYLYQSRGPGARSTPPSSTTYQAPAPLPTCGIGVTQNCEFRDASGRPLPGSPGIMPPPPSTIYN